MHPRVPVRGAQLALLFSRRQPGSWNNSAASGSLHLPPIPSSAGVALETLHHAGRGSSSVSSGDLALGIAALSLSAVALSTSANADVSPSAVQNQLPSSPLSVYDSLVHDLASKDVFTRVRAVEQLAVLANDKDKHESLLQAGIVRALVDSFRASCGAQSSTAPTDIELALSFRVGILRVLADLARLNSSHERFRDAQAAEMLVQTLKEAIPKSIASSGYFSTVIDAWTWTTGLLGLGSTKTVDPGSSARERAAPDEKPSVYAHSAATAEPTVPVSTGGLGDSSFLLPTPPPSTPGVTAEDLQTGLMYHATRCLANLARNSDMHSWLLSHRADEPMTNLLNRAPLRKLPGSTSMASILDDDEQKADTVRHATLALGALCKTGGREIVGKKGHRPLITILGQNTDAIAQTYAAGGIRNLARHVPNAGPADWQIHRDIVVDGVPDALKTALEGSNPQTLVFAALAVGDILTTQHPKAEIICRRMTSCNQGFAALLSSGNSGVARACQRSLDLIYSGYADEAGVGLSTEGTGRLQALSEAVVQHTGSLVRGVTTNSDVIGLKAIAAICLDRNVANVVVEKGGLPVLVDLLPNGKEPGQLATTTLARITSHSDHLAEVILRGGMRAVAARKRGIEDSRWESAVLANFAREEKYRPEVAQLGIDVFLRSVQSEHLSARREGARGLFNLTIGGVSRVLVSQKGALVPLVRIASSDDAVSRKYAVGAVAAISEVFGVGARVVECGAIKALLKAVNADPSLSRDAARCFAQLSNHVEAHNALAVGGAAAWLVATVSRGDVSPETLQHAVPAICNIAYTSGIPNSALREAGAVSAVTGLASGMYPPLIGQYARIALKNLRREGSPALQHAEPHGRVEPM